MSFKGFTKAVTRAPQSFRQKFKMGEQTEDPVYEDAERRFQELEQETKKLSEESKRYSSAVNGDANTSNWICSVHGGNFQTYQW